MTHKGGTITYMKQELQTRATVLRKQGKSIKSIARTLRVSSSTASRWCRDIRMSPINRQRLDENHRKASLKALTPWIEKNRLKKATDLIEQKKLGKKDLGVFSRQDLRMVGLGLYWGEGYKRGNQEWGFTNSDPAVIRLIMKWLNQCYGVDSERIYARLTINSLYKDECDRITKEWSKNTGMSVSQFSKPTFITAYGKPGRDPRTYRGTLRIKVRKGISLRRRILASIEALSN